MNKQKDQDIKDILKDVETTTTNFNKINNNDEINPQENNNIENNKNEQNIHQSIDDIRKIFNNDYQSNNMNNNINNLYGNNNVKDTRINNIFKNELISSDSSFFNKNRSRGNNKPVIPRFNQEYQYNYDNNNIENRQNGQDDSFNYNSNNNNQNNKYNIKPNHMHKINAIINLLEDLNLENLLHVKNQIIKQIESQK